MSILYFLSQATTHGTNDEPAGLDSADSLGCRRHVDFGSPNPYPGGTSVGIPAHVYPRGGGGRGDHLDGRHLQRLVRDVLEVLVVRQDVLVPALRPNLNGPSLGLRKLMRLELRLPSAHTVACSSDRWPVATATTRGCIICSTGAVRGMVCGSAVAGCIGGDSSG